MSHHNKEPESILLVNNLNINTEFSIPPRYLLLTVNALSFYHRTLAMRAQRIRPICCKKKVYLLFWSVHEREERDYSFPTGTSD